MQILVRLVTALCALANAILGVVAAASGSRGPKTLQHDGFPSERTTWGFSEDWIFQVDLSGLKDLFVCDRDAQRSHGNLAGYLIEGLGNAVSFLWDPLAPRPTLWEELHAYIRGTPLPQHGGFWREMWYGKPRVKTSLWEIISDRLWEASGPKPGHFRLNTLSCSLRDFTSYILGLGSGLCDLVEPVIEIAAQNLDGIIDQGPGPVVGGIFCVALVLGVTLTLEPAARRLAALLPLSQHSSGPPAICTKDMKSVVLCHANQHRRFLPCIPNVLQGSRVSYIRHDGVPALLGRGASGAVYLGRLDNEVQVAVKVFRNGFLSAAGVVVEAAKGCYLNRSGVSPHTYGIIGLRPTRGYCRLALVCQYIGRPEGSWTLYKQLSDPSATPLTLEQGRRLVLHLLRCVKTMHIMGIVHNDLKFDNVLLDGTVPYITDFGNSLLVTDLRVYPAQPDDLEDFLTKHPHVSPEMFSEGRISTASDIYGIGFILTHLARHCRDTRMALMASRCRHHQPARRATIDDLIQELLR